MADIQAYEPGPPQPDEPAGEEKFDSHLDKALDDEDEYRQQQTRKPVFVDVVAKDDTRQPILPAALHSWENLGAAARYHLGRFWHQLGYHAVRAVPLYLPKMLLWAPIGAGRIIGRQLVSAGIRQSWQLQQVSADRKDSEEWRKLRDDFWADVKWRVIVVVAELFVAVVGLVMLWTVAPRWVLALTVAIALPWLAHLGRPKTAPIVRPAVVTTRFRRINPDVVLRAYYAAGLGHPDKRDMQIMFPGRMARDVKETGSMVPIDLPFGKTFDDVIAARAKIASGLDVSVQQVFLTRGDRERRHQLFVTDQDPLALPVGHTDMLDCKPRNIWRPIPLGRDERDRAVKLALLWKAVLVAAQPRKGKTFFVRMILLYAALDPWVKILGCDGKKSSDYDKLRLVAHRWVIGDAPNPRDNDPLTHLEEMLDEVLAHIAKVNDVLASLPVEQCPEGVLTEELSRDPRYPDLRVWVLVGEEFQVYFETEDQDYNKQIAHKLQPHHGAGPVRRRDPAGLARKSRPGSAPARR
jgi:S-DNA-T family DNA segregation ATPase FtsK/SpoIIIE